MLRKVVPLLCLASAILAGPAFAARDQSFLRFLSVVAQKEARAQAQKIKVPLDQRGFKGQLEILNSDKIQVQVSSFQLKNDTITASVAVQGDFRISGTWTMEGESIKVHADVAAKVSVTGLAKVERQGADFFLAPTLNDCDFSIAKIVIREPTELAEGESLLAELANAAFQRHKADIIQRINSSMKKYPIDF